MTEFCSSFRKRNRSISSLETRTQSSYFPGKRGKVSIIEPPNKNKFDFEETNQQFTSRSLSRSISSRRKVRREGIKIYPVNEHYKGARFSYKENHFGMFSSEKPLFEDNLMSLSKKSSMRARLSSRMTRHKQKENKKQLIESIKTLIGDTHRIWKVKEDSNRTEKQAEKAKLEESKKENSDRLKLEDLSSNQPKESKQSSLDNTEELPPDSHSRRMVPNLNISPSDSPQNASPREKST